MEIFTIKSLFKFSVVMNMIVVHNSRQVIVLH